MSNCKADNQWYGKGFEQAIMLVKKQLSPINPYPEHIPETDWLELLQDATTFIVQYENFIEPITTIEWIGCHTISCSGDLIINGYIEEVKRVTSGTGTWVNSTINHIYEYLPKNFPSHIDSMRDFGFLDIISKYTTTGSKRWTKNKYTPNPLNVVEAKAVATSELDEWDNKWRPFWMKQLYDGLCSDLNNLKRFIDNCITKAIIGKQAPKHLLVFNQNTKILHNAINYQQCLNQKQITVHNNEKGFVLGPIRVAPYWKNHTCCNLAMNIFLT